MIAIVNGCFDLFHSGHKYIFSIAVKIIDEIIVLLNSDESVRSLKGNGRPIENWHTRANNILDYLQEIQPGHVHKVYEIKNEEDLRVQIYTINPDLIIKGNDRPDTRDIIGSKDYPILIIPRIPNVSTTIQLTKLGNNSKVT